MKTNSPGQNPPLRVGLFGGTFNPIHIGHCQVALDVVQQFDLDRIYVIPSSLPPHKSKGALAAAADRYEMARLALKDYPSLQVSDVEIRRPGQSYTYDTVQQFKAGLPQNGRLFFILGMDAFLEINTWKAFNRLFDEAAFIVMSRPQDDAEPFSLQEAIAAFAAEFISANYTLKEDDDRVLRHPYKQPIFIASVTAVRIASSQIRRMIRRKEAIDAWVAPAVRRYIEKRGLYR